MAGHACSLAWENEIIDRQTLKEHWPASLSIQSVKLQVWWENPSQGTKAENDREEDMVPSSGLWPLVQPCVLAHMCVHTPRAQAKTPHLQKIMSSDKLFQKGFLTFLKTVNQVPRTHRRGLAGTMAVPLETSSTPKLPPARLPAEALLKL